MTRLINKAALTAIAHEKGFNMSLEGIKAFNNKVAEIAEKACKRARANKRKTVMPQDI